ncbi:MAG TPA: hypothetical protein VK430_03990 [Xanthobacteraceae bacterium]|nr:hypothetical protein [Xanthobacteraceae bacterium]
MRMLLRGMFVVLDCMQVVTMSYLGVVGGLFMIARLVMLGGFTMVLGRLLVMMRGLFVMLVDIVIGHVPLRFGDVLENRNR